MTRLETRCEARFRAAAPRELYERLWRYLARVYPGEYEKVVNNYRFEAALTLLPHQRRAQIETDLPQEAHAMGLRSSVERFPNTTDTFVLVHIADDVKLIVCYVRNKDAAVRYAQARANLANENNQPYLLPPPVERTVLGPQTLFAILTHNADANSVGQFEGGQVIFPPPDQVSRLGSLDLKQEMERVQQEDAEQAAVVKRKVEIKIKKGGDVS